MHKSTSRSLLRSHGVQHIAPQRGYIADDTLPDCDAMTLPQLVEEKSRLHLELARCENEIRASRAQSSGRVTKGAGYRKTSLEHRLADINGRIKLAHRLQGDEAWREAIAEVCPEFLSAIDARRRELAGAGHG